MPAAAAVVMALIIGAGQGPASASPLSAKKRDAAQARARIASSQAAVQRAVRDYEAARSRVASIQAETAESTERLDALVDRQEVLQRRLGARAAGIYRVGPLGYVEILARSATFEQLSARWEQLTRVVRQEALVIQELKKTKAEVARTTEELLKRQESASAQLRALETAKADTAGRLSSDRASLALFQKEIARLEAQQAAQRADVVRVAATPKVQYQPLPDPVSRLKGTGSWSSAVCSHYGPGFYGKRTASGEIVRPDSMIVAHKTLRFGTVIEFAYRGRTAVARVADRGPYVSGREFDLGPGTSRVLGFSGVGTVQYRIIRR